MAVKWISSKYPGVRFYEHPTRKHGVKPDRYFSIRSQVGGKRREEGLGWASEGMTEQKAAGELAKLKEAHRTGTGPLTMEEKRKQASEQRQAELEAKAQEERDNLTFEQVFRERYLPQAKANKKPTSVRTEELLFRLWIEPVIGLKAFKDIAPIHLERIKKRMADAGRSPRSIVYALAVIRQVFNFSRDHDLFIGPNPVSRVGKPKADNRRIRFLAPEEADNLLEALKVRSQDMHDMALLSLNAGLRAGEIFSLTWPDVDFGNSVLTLRDTKSGRTRQVPMTAAVLSMLEDRKKQANGNQLVFPAETGGRVVQVSDTFNRVVAVLGFNNEVEDPRQKVVFHTLRHTCASWLVQNGVPLITVGRLLGHSTTAMTERYSHLAPDHFRQAVETLEKVRKRKNAKRMQAQAIGSKAKVDVAGL